MHVRKQRMFDLADAFLVLPGGIGTLDETLEIVTWRQLEQHDKPVIVIDVDGYWRPLLALLDHVVDRGFAAADLHSLYTVADGPQAALQLLARMPARPPGTRPRPRTAARPSPAPPPTA